MDHRAELGEFLRSRRARLRPEDTGLRTYGERRRVPGLRREELAQLAGVSADYYVRFEQGRTGNVSAEIVDAIAGALRLGADEHAHLRRLVQTAQSSHPAEAGAPAPQVVRPGLVRLLESMPETPAFIAGRGTELLAWNQLFAALVVDVDALPARMRNKARLVFLHEETRQRFVNWQVKARDLVAYLRMDLGRHPNDPGFRALIDDLSEQSAEFRQLWAEQEVKEKTHGAYHLRHPELGEFTLAYESLRLPDDPDQTLVTYTAAAGSPSEAALRILADRARRGENLTEGVRFSA
ncbi:helix-turn-helix transcriptional regulator [Yinghuangia soli]|uniref:Helix-turn-helix transcriptional regulator n=1 Tax=Yinghuangia soli TaxID=2908204 RepID=A0AA41Q0D2_9ACTN|nr:helix-turn-helix transcriptional regulator [Yinghuangia soli]MCF2527742.1 helix-turn-helix transcriptional regulator [Yinghuangia soli]